jgi:hypothetical protein
MKTKEEIVDRIRECEITIRSLRLMKNEIAIEKEKNILLERNTLLWVLGNE